MGSEGRNGAKEIDPAPINELGCRRHAQSGLPMPSACILRLASYKTLIV